MLSYLHTRSWLLSTQHTPSSNSGTGMRETHVAGGYTGLDPSSPMFIQGDTLYVPAVLASFQVRPWLKAIGLGLGSKPSGVGARSYSLRLDWRLG